MTIDLGSNVLDVAVGLSFIFFLLSLIVSAGTEAAAWLTSRRAKNLESGLRELLADPAKANQVLEHPLISNVAKASLGRRIISKIKGSDPKSRPPSYLSPRAFALAFLDTLTGSGADGTAKNEVNILTAVNDSVATLDPALKAQVVPLLEEAENDIANFRKSLEKWFDDAMDRVSGWYKRWAQTLACVFAIIVAIGLNVDSVRVANRLANDETVRSSVVGAANQALAEQGAGNNTEGHEPDPLAAGQKADEAVKELSALNLPIGWSAANDTVNLATIGGWLITAIAISLGAPFWFDSLGKLSRLRTTGKKPSSPNDEQES